MIAASIFSCLSTGRSTAEPSRVDPTFIPPVLPVKFELISAVAIVDAPLREPRGSLFKRLVRRSLRSREAQSREMCVQTWLTAGVRPSERVRGGLINPRSQVHKSRQFSHRQRQKVPRIQD